jgi:hypothetical protein
MTGRRPGATVAAMILYTCKLQNKGASWHPCGIACRALDEARHRYEVREVRGYVSAPWTWLTRRRDRALIRNLSGQNGVPVLVLDDDDVIAGSERIKRWAEANPARGFGRPHPRVAVGSRQ